MSSARKILCLVSLILTCFSCSSRNGSRLSADVAERFNKTVEKGKVIDSICCRKDASQSYALYLPAHYTPSRRWPVIYAFDSHGHGNVPVKLFQHIAEKLGFVVIGSNNSKNGLSGDDYNYIINHLLDDTHEKISIDSRRVYTAGHSGGARLACYVAASYGGVAGVIACSAGFQPDPAMKNRFDFIGIAGTEDMNFLEMYNLDKDLNQSLLKHYFLSYKGKHAWPPQPVLDQALTWMQMNAMRNKLTPVDQTLIDEFARSQNTSVAGTKDILEKYEILKFTSDCLNGLCDLTSYNKQLQNLKNSVEVKNHLDRMEKITNVEFSMQKKYSAAFMEKSISWWQPELVRLSRQKGKNGDENSMNKRLLGFVSLMSYTYLSHALSEQDINNAEKFAKIYRLSDPANPDCYYLYSWLYIELGKNKEALSSLNKAVELGFSDKKKLEQDPVFAEISSSPEFTRILQKIKSE
ncbi:MAG: hypothetical protein Q8905_08960 [Bacteroidota bacterium]|nr:hypothetical protein [Bacteroidota bacterium]